MNVFAGASCRNYIPGGCGREPKMAFYRTEKGFEVDVILSIGEHIVPIEIKSSMTYGAHLIRNLATYCSEDVRAKSPVLLYDGDSLGDLGAHGIQAINWKEFSLSNIRLA